MSVFPCHCPVENPAKVCGASSGGCGRPSIQTVRGVLSTAPLMFHAITRPLTGSDSDQIFRPNGPITV